MNVFMECIHAASSLFVSQLIEEVQVKQPEVEFVLERADHLYKDSPPNQPGKVRESNTTPMIHLLKGTNKKLEAHMLFPYATNVILWKHFQDILSVKYACLLYSFGQ